MGTDLRMKKRCPICEKTKPIEQFARNRSTKSGFGGRCKPCHAALALKRRQANRERDREIRRAFYQRHAERISVENAAARKADPAKWSVKDRANYERRTATPEGRAQFRAWQEDWKLRNPERNAEISRRCTRAWRKANPEKAADSYRAWAAANPEKYRAGQQRGHANRKARLRSADGVRILNIDRAVVFERDGGICGICDSLVDATDWHMDHVVPLARGGEHTYGNVQVSHPRCNMRKHAKLQEELIPA